MMSKDLITRELLLKIAEKDDKQAFSIFFRHYYSKLIRFALLFLPSYDKAEDIVSEVLIRLLRKRKELFEMQNFEAYLYSSVKNEALNHIKASNRSKKLQLNIDNENDFISSDYVDPLHKIISDELRDLVYSSIEALPPKRKMVYKLVKDDGLKYREVAKLMDISERTVEVHLKIAIKELREKVSQYLQQGKKSSPLRISKMINLILMAI